MSEVTIAPSSDIGNSPDASGNGTQQHIIYAANSGVWWCFFFISTQTLAAYYSSNFTSWTKASTTLTTKYAHGSVGRSISVGYQNLGGVDVIHITTGYQVSSSDHEAWHIRAVVTSNTVSFSSENQVSSAGTLSYSLASAGQTTLVTSSGYVVDNTQFALNSLGGGEWMDGDAWRFANTDNGSSWSQGTAQAGGATTSTDVMGFSLCDSGWLGATGSSTWIFIAANSTDSGPPNRLYSATWNGTAWSSASAVFSSNTNILNNQWAAVMRTTSDCHVVYQSSTATFTHRRWNGTSWGAGSSIPTLTFKSGSGVTLATDGTNVWLFAIDSSNNIRYIKWNGSSWDASWSTLESSTATRNYVSCYPSVVNNTIAVIWTEGSGSSFSVAGETLSTSSTVSGSATLNSSSSVASLGSDSVSLGSQSSLFPDTLTAESNLFALGSDSVVLGSSSSFQTLGSDSAVIQALAFLASLGSDASTLGSEAGVQTLGSDSSVLSDQSIIGAMASASVILESQTSLFPDELTSDSTVLVLGSDSSSLASESVILVTAQIFVHASVTFGSGTSLSFAGSDSSSFESGSSLSVTSGVFLLGAATLSSSSALDVSASVTGAVTDIIHVFLTASLDLITALLVGKQFFNLFVTVQHLSAQFIGKPPVANPQTTHSTTMLAQNSARQPINNLSVCSVVVTFPDNSTSNFSLGSGVTNNNDGTYTITYQTKGLGNISEIWTFTDQSGNTAQYQNIVPTSY